MRGTWVTIRFANAAQDNQISEIHVMEERAEAGDACPTLPQSQNSEQIRRFLGSHWNSRVSKIAPRADSASVLLFGFGEIQFAATSPPCVSMTKIVGVGGNKDLQIGSPCQTAN
jgi:hypothetical protein